MFPDCFRFSRLFRGRICLELVKRLPVHRYSVDIFSYSGPSGILYLTEGRVSLGPVLRA